jgi:4-amino-4-deoxy-L-arabinose transferase-like glycosyltransferase
MYQVATSLPSVNGLRLLWLLSLLLAFFYNLGAFPLFDLDEGAFSQATREMFLRDNFLTTYLNGEPRYDKPILIYWLQALSIKLLGTNEVAFRLPSAIAATFWSLTVVAFTWSISTPRNAFIAGILMTGAAGVGVIGKAATADALLNFCLSGTMFSLYLYLTKCRLRYLVAAAVFAGLGFMTKGPIALLIPAMVSFIFSLWSGRLNIWLRMVSNPLAWLTFLLVGMPWYIVLYLREGPGFLENFIGTHNLGRFANEMEGHGGDWWYYLPAILLVAFPFGLLILRPLWRLKSISSTDIGRFLLSWFFFVLVFFSFSATKLPHYILYGLTPLFVLTALHLHEKPALKSVFLPLFLLIIALIALPNLIEHLLPSIEDPQLSSALINTKSSFKSPYFLLLGIVLVLSLWLFMSKRWPHQGRLLSAGLISIFMISEFLLPIVAEIQQQAIKQAGEVAAKHDRDAVIWRLNTPSFSVYSEKITPRRKPVAGELVLTKTHHLQEFPHREMLFEKNGIALALINNHESDHVSGITPPNGQILDLDSPPDITIGSLVDIPVKPEPTAIPADQLQGNDDARIGTLGVGDHTRRRVGGKRHAAGSAQKPSTLNHVNPDVMYRRWALGPLAEKRAGGTQTFSGNRSSGNQYYWPGAETRKLPFRPHVHPFRATRMHGRLDEVQHLETPVPYPAGHYIAGGTFENCCGRSLATGYPRRYGHRMAVGNNHKYPLPEFSCQRLIAELGRSPAFALHPLSAACLRHRLYKCNDPATRYRPFCVSFGLPRRSETNQVFFLADPRWQ